MAIALAFSVRQSFFIFGYMNSMTTTGPVADPAGGDTRRSTNLIRKVSAEGSFELWRATGKLKTCGLPGSCLVYPRRFRFSVTALAKPSKNL